MNNAKIYFRDTTYNWLLILCIVILFFSSCSKEETLEEIANDIELVTNIQLIIADGNSTAIIKLFKGLNSIKDANDYILRLNGEIINLEGYRFNTTTAGTYSFEAEYKGVVTNRVEVTAREVKQYSNITIPVVFHIGNFNDGSFFAGDAIATELQKMNKIFRNELGALEPNAVDTNIEFRLATINPDAELLNEPGIMRYSITKYDIGCQDFSGTPECADIANDKLLGHFEDQSFYLDTVWDPNNYINIWVYPTQLQAGGFAISTPLIFDDFPLIGTRSVSRGGNLDISFQLDEEHYFPIFAVNNQLDVLAHEMGHLLSLQHPQNEDCLASDYCNDTYQYNEVSLEPCEGNMGTGSPTSIMDYRGARDCFTYDQRERMRHVLEHGAWYSNLKDSDR